MSSSTSNEEMLTTNYKRLLDHTAPLLAKEGKKVVYDHFDFSQHCKKGTAILDTYINDMMMTKLSEVGNEKEPHHVSERLLNFNLD
jgi:hypothetical protein